MDTRADRNADTGTKVDPGADPAAHPVVERVEVVLPGDPLEETTAFLERRFGFRLTSLFPADDPVVATLVGHGLHVRLDRRAKPGAGAGTLFLHVPGAETTVRHERAPNGTRVVWIHGDEVPLDRPLAPSYTLVRGEDEGGWRRGRAGMLYRDLIPGRQGGRFVASHIRVPEGGPVPDYVHYHRVRLQLIYCRRGWSELVYEDQGPPFRFEEGDCVLQPPGIRHRVLTCSNGFEVVELASPGVHETRVDPELELPMPEARPGRTYRGQRFHHHRAKEASWEPGPPGYSVRDLDLAGASGGRLAGRVLRAGPDAGPSAARHSGELLFAFCLAGEVGLASERRSVVRLSREDAVVLPPDERYAWNSPSEDLELLVLEVAAPGK